MAVSQHRFSEAYLPDEANSAVLSYLNIFGEVEPVREPYGRHIF